MRAHFKALFTSALLVLISLPSLSALALDCEEARTEVYFGNGMFNSRLAAGASARALEKRLRNENVISNDQLVGVAYNTNEPALVQLLQVVSQKEHENSARFYLWLSNLALAPASFRNEALKVAQQIHAEAFIKDGDLKKQLEAYVALMKTGGLITVVAHSQGNFYANAVKRTLLTQENYSARFAIVGVATPTSSIEGGGPYTTLTQDQVINAVRLAKGSLVANTTNSIASGLGHEFVSQYLKGDRSGEKILSDIKSVSTEMIHAFARPTKSELAYQDPSLEPFLRRACTLKSLHRKFTDGECIALTALDRTYSWNGEPREVRSIKGLRNWISDCAKDYWNDKERFDFLHCSMLGDNSGLDLVGFGSPLKMEFVISDHPECHWHGTEVGLRTNEHAIAEAKRFIESPKYP